MAIRAPDGANNSIFILRIDGLVIRQTSKKKLYRIAQAGGKVISEETSRNAKNMSTRITLQRTLHQHINSDPAKCRQIDQTCETRSCCWCRWERIAPADGLQLFATYKYNFENANTL